MKDNDPKVSKAPSRIISGHPDTEVKVLLKMDTATRKAWLEVGVRSMVRDGLWGWKKVDADSSRLRDEVRQAAEKIAIYQCAAYRDGHNPVAAGKAAVDALEDVLEQAQKARKAL